MITEKYLAKKQANSYIAPPFVMGTKPPAPSPSPAPAPASHKGHGLSLREVAQASKLKINAEEYSRRDKIVKEAYANCPFHVGQVLEPRTPNNLSEYGKCHIVGIAKDYYDYGGIDSDWDNVARIITFEPVDPKPEQVNRHYHGTINWFKKPESESCTC